MKRKIIITGISVHDVGYRVFLLNRALSEGLDGFSATNELSAEGVQQVVILCDGDEESITDFYCLVQHEFPPHANVTNITIEPYQRRIIKIIDYMHLIQVEQLEKGIPAILSIQSSQEQMVQQQDQMLDKQDQMLHKQDQMLNIQDQMVKVQNQTVHEIHELRSDLKTELDDRFNKIEHELTVIKEVLHKSGIMG